MQEDAEVLELRAFHLRRRANLIEKYFKGQLSFDLFDIPNQNTKRHYGRRR